MEVSPRGQGNSAIQPHLQRVNTAARDRAAQNTIAIVLPPFLMPIVLPR